MYQSICDFTSLAGKTLQKRLENQFQKQMDATDGEYVMWEDTAFSGVQLEPATCVKSQAILQFFAGCGCPFSMLRLGRSLAIRNSEHGPIVSDSLAIKYMLRGFEMVENNLYDERIKGRMISLMKSSEFKAACDLIVTYEKELGVRVICPEIKALIIKNISLRTQRLQ